MVVHIYNSSYLGGKDRRIVVQGSKSDPGENGKILSTKN
jgi:hypothetical protein